MKQAELDIIKARCEAVTPEPWVTSDEDDNDPGLCYFEMSDTKFIAHAHEDILLLVAEVERLREDQAGKRRKLTEKGIFINRFEAALASTQEKLKQAQAEVERLQTELEQADRR